MLKIRVDVLEVQSGTGKKSGKPYHIAILKIRDSGKVGKAFLKEPVEVGENLEMELDISPNQELFFGVRFSPVTD